MMIRNFCLTCLICAKHNPQGNLRPRREQFPKPTYPFQRVCMDFIELNKGEEKRFCLVIIDVLPNELKYFHVHRQMHSQHW